MQISRMILAFLLTSELLAVNLSEVVRDALSSSTDYLSARAVAAAAKDSYSIAKSTWLPQMNFDASKGFAETRPSPVGNADQQDVKSLSYGVTLNQKLFDIPAWLGVEKQSFALQKAMLDELSVRQNIIYSVSVQYFDVLQKISEYSSQKAKLKSYQEQFRRVRQEYSAGKAAKPELAQVEAQYLLANSELLSAKNGVLHSLKKLSQITGKDYKSINLLGGYIPLARPKPARAAAWVKLMYKQNVALKASLFTLKSARQDVEIARSSGAPVFNFNAGIRRYRPLNFQNLNSGTSKNWGVSMTWPVVTGGNGAAVLSQSGHMLDKTEQLHTALMRELKQQTTNTFYDLSVGVLRVQAAQKAVDSAKIALGAIKDGYNAGMQTNSDVLDSITRVHDANLQLIKSKYAYLSDMLQLKLLVGVLSEKDLFKLSRLFDRKQSLNGYY